MNSNNQIQASGDIRLDVSSLKKAFQGRGNILDDISLNVRCGEAVALIGGNGSGKSTLIRCCMRLIEPDSGDIVFLQENVSRLNGKQLRRLRSRVGMVFQKHNLVPRLTVLSNVIHGAIGREGGVRTLRHNIAPKRLRDEAIVCLEKVGLAHLAGYRADMLSGGESQRVAIARALMQRPDFIIADEPVASLDPKAGKEVMELFYQLNKEENLTLLYVSHDLEHALKYSDRLIGLKKGQILLEGRSSSFTQGDLHEVYH